MRCKHGQPVDLMCPSCELEVMEDFILHNIETFQPSEIAQCIEEGLVSKSQVTSTLIWEFGSDKRGVA